MRPLTAIVAVFLSSTLPVMVSAQVPPVIGGPRPEARVVDETGTLSVADSAEIERLVTALDAVL